MTVTAEQWAAAAADAGMTLDELHAKIAEIDNSDQRLPLRPRSWSRNAAHQTAPPMHFDRDGDPLTTGEWAVLFEWARSYKFIAEQILPNRYWIATIWTGTDEHGDDDQIVMETSVFLLDPERNRLPPAVHRVVHASLADALRIHGELVDRFAAAGVSVA